MTYEPVDSEALVPEIDEVYDPSSLRPQELSAVYDISRAVSRAVDMETTLEEITRLARPVFIFDNFVLYVRGSERVLEPKFARAIGRGRFNEADLAWGEQVAYDAFHSSQTVIRFEQLAEENADRTKTRFFIGIPLRLGDQLMGVQVFIRFGGPPFLPDQVRLADFIADNIAQLLEHQQLVEKIANLEAQRRLHALQDGFISMISHELLTPLGFIKGYATTLLRDDIQWEEETRREFLMIIDEETDRLRELIDNLLDSSRLQAGTLKMEFRVLRLDVFLKEVQMRARVRHTDLDLQLDIQSPGVKALIDPTRLAQVFDNLVSNAVKYAPGSPVYLRIVLQEDRVLISVKDRGPGIPPEHLENLFKRFFRVPGSDSSARGTGLGLYICRQIVQAHQGEITVESTLGEGTCFNILLPASG
jgi:signal transduction histidine kinase